MTDVKKSRKKPKQENETPIKSLKKMENQMSKSKHIGSDFDDFLKEEGIYQECTAEAIKRVVAFQLEQEMKKQKLTKTKFAQQLERNSHPNNYRKFPLVLEIS